MIAYLRFIYIPQSAYRVFKLKYFSHKEVHSVIQFLPWLQKFRSNPNTFYVCKLNNLQITGTWKA